MLKIGEFSKLSHITVKALRFYEKEGILMPASTDQWTGYRYYETGQLEDAARIKAFRQMGLSIDEIRGIRAGADIKTILSAKAKALESEKQSIDGRLSIIKHILEEKEMKYQVTVKDIPSCIVYYSEATLENYSDLMQFIPMCGQKCMELNPDLKCSVPEYEFCEYLDGEYRETDVRIRHNEAVEKIGKSDDFIKFREIPETKVLSIFHRGPYESIGEAYAYIMKYADENGYKVSGLARECYIDGIWNKEDPSEWLTELQLPIE
ncbi:MAG: MerR family transcriptional regulator [Bacillota bacterium]|nr:MerR family transcriptional regulator [Bacillota bacterium]